MLNSDACHLPTEQSLDRFRNINKARRSGHFNRYRSIEQIGDRFVDQTLTYYCRQQEIVRFLLLDSFFSTQPSDRLITHAAWIVLKQYAHSLPTDLNLVPLTYVAHA